MLRVRYGIPYRKKNLLFNLDDSIELRFVTSNVSVSLLFVLICYELRLSGCRLRSLRRSLCRCFRVFDQGFAEQNVSKANLGC